MKNFDGTAFVAYADLCGFKEFMRDPRESKAYDALNRLYNKAYDLGQEHQTVSALAVSDCVVAWVADNANNLGTLLTYLKSLHAHMLDGDYLMRTTVALGQFRYQQRIELHNLQKGMLHGDGYLNAFLANDKEEAGSIVILEHGDLTAQSQFAPHHAPLIQRTGKQLESGNWEFFWSVMKPEGVDKLLEARRESKHARFSALIRAYRGKPASG